MIILLQSISIIFLFRQNHLILKKMNASVTQNSVLTQTDDDMNFELIT